MERIGERKNDRKDKKLIGKMRLEWLNFDACAFFPLLYVQLDALEYVHSGHFVFADIKSQNLMMGVGAQANRVFIADFGIASKYFFSYNKKVRSHAIN